MEEQSTIDKTVGIVAHITLIGWIIALVMNGEKKDEEKAFGAFYLRQVLGIFIFGIGSWLLMMILAIILINIPTIGAVMILLFSLAIYGSLLTLWILSLVSAVNGQKKELPVVGGMIHKMLGTAFE